MSIRDVVRETLIKSGYLGRRLVIWIWFRKIRRIHPRADVYAISHPRSGGTWLIALLAKAVALHFGLDQGDDSNPLGVFEKGYIASTLPEVPWIISSHDTSANPISVEENRRNPTFQRYSNKKVIFLVRDPRDVLVSYYFFRTRREGETHSLSDFIRHPWWGVDPMLAFLADWYKHRGVPADFMLVRYEDMRRDTEHIFGQIMRFIGVECTDAVIRQAIDFASFDHMKKMAKKELAQIKGVAEVNPNDPESSKTRRGVVGGYVDYLSAEDIAYIEDRMAQVLPAELGYTPSMKSP